MIISSQGSRNCAIVTTSSVRSAHGAQHPASDFKKPPGNRLATAFVSICFGVLCLAAGNASAVTCTWSGGSGAYSNVAQWDCPIVPCGAVFDVQIPDHASTVDADLPTCDVNTWMLGTDRVFQVAPGRSYTVSGAADIYGIVNATGGDILAPIADFPGAQSRVHASNGSLVLIGAMQYSSAAYWPGGDMLSATGADTRLDLSTVQSIDASFNDGSGTVRGHNFPSSAGAVMDLSGVLTVTGPARIEDWLQFRVDTGGAIDLGSLHTVGGGGLNYFQATGANTSLSLPALATAANVVFRALGGSTLSVAGGGPVLYNSSAYWPGGDMIFAADAGSLLDLRAIQTINAAFNDGSGTARGQNFEVNAGATIDLSGLETAIGPARIEDWIQFRVNQNGVMDLGSLRSVSGGGLTYFQVTDQTSTLSLPALETATNVAFIGTNGATLDVSGAAPIIYNSSGFWPGGNLISAADAGTLLNLSAIRSINAAFNDGSGTARGQNFSASGDAMMDLSGLQSVTGAARIEDWIQFLVTDGGTIDFGSLRTVNGGGVSYFQATGPGDVLSLPALEMAGNTYFGAADGATLNVAGSAPVTYNSSGFWPGGNLISAAGAGSSLQLSAIRSINAAFNDGSGSVRGQNFQAIEGASVDLSGVATINSPARSEDWVQFKATDGGQMDLSSLHTASGSGDIYFTVAGDSSLDISSLRSVVGSRRTYFHLTDSEMRFGVFPGFTGAGDAELVLNDATSIVRVADSLRLSPVVRVDAADDSLITVGEDYAFEHTDEARLGVGNAIMQFDGAGPQLLEVGGFDIGTIIPSDDNFGIGQLVVGGQLQSTTVNLRDAIDNGNLHDLCVGQREALYVLGRSSDPNADALSLENGSTLRLNGINVYAKIGGVLTHINLWLTPGVTLPYGNGFLETGTVNDTDFDGVEDNLDNCVVIANSDQRDTDGDGFGNLCDADIGGPGGPGVDDGIVNVSDLGILRIAFFSTPSDAHWNPHADFNGDGRVNPGDLGILRSLFFAPPGPSCAVTL